MTEANAVVAPQKTIRDKVDAVDALAVATRILSQGTRGAMQASTVEIIALAQRVMTLTNLADLTFGMLAASDRAAATPKAERDALLRVLHRKVDLVGVSLEALGYGTETPAQQEEKNDGGSQD